MQNSPLNENAISMGMVLTSQLGKCRDSDTGTKRLALELSPAERTAMFVNSVTVDVVGGAHIIAANYFKHTGRIPVEMDIFQPLFDSSVDD
jgi:hypothetical protein